MNDEARSRRAGEADSGSVEPLGLAGPYRLLRELGRGGMGVVYLAVRADGQFEKRVALKLLHPGFHDEELLRRFERERRILAHLDHPGIARLLDEGVAEDGRPYLVLEHVEGLPIDRWCDAERLSLRERLELFREVCAAIDSAHRSLVVHRDLKPSNILVDRQGRPRLLDFGIAKELAPGLEGESAEATATSGVPGTPSHASPEQVRGAPLTTASDTWSAGVVLYQLLCGHLPFEVEGQSPREAERTIREVEPLPPSAAILRPARERDGDGRLRECTPEELAARRRSTPAALSKELAGDLDTVLGKALHKDPAHRYSTAAELAADLHRFLAGLPIGARADTFRYRARKFVARNRALAGAIAVVFLSLVAGLSLSSWQYRRASLARDELGRQLVRDQERSRELEAQTEELRVARGEAQEQQALAEKRAAELERRTEELATEHDRAEAERTRAEGNLAEVQELNLELAREERIAERRYQNTRELTRALVFDVRRAIAPLDGAERARAILVQKSLEHLDRLAASEDADAPLLREVAEDYLQLAADEELSLPDRLEIARRARSALLAAIESLERKGLREGLTGPEQATRDELRAVLAACDGRIADLELLLSIEDGSIEKDS